MTQLHRLCSHANKGLFYFIFYFFFMITLEADFHFLLVLLTILQWIISIVVIKGEFTGLYIYIYPEAFRFFFTGSYWILYTFLAISLEFDSQFLLYK